MGVFLFEEALLGFEAQDLNTERYTKVAAAIQNAIQCYLASVMTKKVTTQTSLDCVLRRVDRIESSKEPELVPSVSGVSETAACPPSPIADDPSALLSPTPSFLQSLFLPLHWMPAPVYQLLNSILPCFSSYCPVRLKMCSLFLCFSSII